VVPLLIHNNLLLVGSPFDSSVGDVKPSGRSRKRRVSAVYGRGDFSGSLLLELCNLQQIGLKMEARAGAGGAVLLDPDQWAIEALTTRDDYALLTFLVIVESRFRPQCELVAVAQKVVYLLKSTDVCLVLQIESDGSLHHLAAGADDELVGSCRLAGLRACTLDIS